MSTESVIRFEEFDRFDLLVFQEGQNSAVVRQWPTFHAEVWSIDAPEGREWVGSVMHKLQEEGWEPVSITVHTRGWFLWKRTFFTWLFRRRVPCQRQIGPGGSYSTKRLRPTQDIGEDDPYEWY